MPAIRVAQAEPWTSSRSVLWDGGADPFCYIPLQAVRPWYRALLTSRSQNALTQLSALSSNRAAKLLLHCANAYETTVRTT